MKHDGFASRAAGCVHKLVAIFDEPADRLLYDSDSDEIGEQEKQVREDARVAHREWGGAFG